MPLFFNFSFFYNEAFRRNAHCYHSTRIGCRVADGVGSGNADRWRGCNGANDKVAWTPTPHPSPQGEGKRRAFRL